MGKVVLVVGVMFLLIITGIVVYYKMDNSSCGSGVEAGTDPFHNKPEYETNWFREANPKSNYKLKREMQKIFNFNDDQGEQVMTYLYIVATIDIEDFLRNVYLKAVPYGNLVDPDDIISDVKDMGKFLQNDLLKFLKTTKIDKSDIKWISDLKSYVESIDEETDLNELLKTDGLEVVAERFIKKENSEAQFTKIVSKYNRNITEVSIAAFAHMILRLSYD